jgi:hypothetical protein
MYMYGGRGARTASPVYPALHSQLDMSVEAAGDCELGVHASQASACGVGVWG